MGRGFLVSVESGEKKIGNVGRQYSNTFESFGLKKNDGGDDYSSNQSNSRSSRSDSRDSRGSSYSSYSQDSRDERDVKNDRNDRDAENDRDVKNDRNDRDSENDRQNDIYTEESSESDYERVDRKQKEPEVVAGVKVDDAKPVKKIGSKSREVSIKLALDEEQFVDLVSSDDYDRKDFEQDRKDKKEQDKRDRLEKKDQSRLKKRDSKDSGKNKSKKGRTGSPEKYEPQLSYRNSDEYTRKGTESSIKDLPTPGEPSKPTKQPVTPPAENPNTSTTKDKNYSITSTEPQTLAQNTPQHLSQTIPTKLHTQVEPKYELKPEPKPELQSPPELQAKTAEPEGLHINLGAITPPNLYHPGHNAPAQEPYQQNYTNNNEPS
jgi:hypothetical protein